MGFSARRLAARRCWLPLGSLARHLKPVFPIEYLDKPTRYRTRDFTPVFVWGRSNQLLLIHAETWKTFDEFVKAARTRPLAGGLSGRGSTTRLAGLLAVVMTAVRDAYPKVEKFQAMISGGSYSIFASSLISKVLIALILLALGEH